MFHFKNLIFSQTILPDAASTPSPPSTVPFSLQKREGISWISDEHCITRCKRLGINPHSKAGQGNPIEKKVPTSR